MSQQISWTLVNIFYLAVSSAPVIGLPVSQYPPLLQDILSDVPLGDRHAIRVHYARRCIRRADSLGTNRRRCPIYTCEEVVILGASNLVRPCSRFRTIRHSNHRLRFLASTHYTNYNPWLFAVNLTALILVIIPKLPQVRCTMYAFTRAHTRHSCTDRDYDSCQTSHRASSLLLQRASLRLASPPHR